MKQQIADFSKQLNLEELYLYIFEVWESTEKMLERLSYDELKRKIPKERKGYLESLNRQKFQFVELRKLEFKEE